MIEILGEASKNLPAELRARHADVPWREIGGTRDQLIHAYFDVDLDTVRSIARTDLPVLVPRLEEILRELESRPPD